MARGIQFKFLADTAQLEQGLKRSARKMDDLRDEAVQADRALRNVSRDVDVEVKLKSLAGLKTRLERERAELNAAIGNLDVDLDPSKALRDLARIEREIRKIDGMNARIDVSTDTSGDRGGLLGLLGVGGAGGGFPLVLANLGKLKSGFMVFAGGVAAAAAVIASAVGPGLVGGLLAFKGLQLGESLLTEYATIEAANRKARVVFAETEGMIREWVATLGPRTGLTQREALGLAASVQDLLVPAGFSRQAAADITKSVVERGAALAKFSGRDTAEGIEAITAALLGEREQLQGLGVAISQSEVDTWLKNNAAAVKGMSDSQAEVAATLALIEQKSGDAWAAFQEGPQGAQAVLDTMKSSLGDLKDKLVTSVGVPLLEIISGLSGSDMSAPFRGISDWLDKHQDTVKQFLINMVDLLLIGAEQAVNLGKGLLEGLVLTWPILRETARLLAVSAGAGMQAAGALLMMSPATRDLGKSLIDAGRGTGALVEGALKAGDNFVNNFAPSAIKALEATQAKLAETREKLADMNNTRLQLEVLLEQGQVDNVKRELNAMTSDQLVKFISTLDPNSADASEIQLGLLAADRIADFFPELDGKSLAEVQAVVYELQREKTIRALITVDGRHVEEFLARQRTMRVNLVYAQTGTRPGNVPQPAVPQRLAVEPGGGGGISMQNISIRLDGRQLRYMVQEEVSSVIEAGRMQAVA